MVRMFSLGHSAGHSTSRFTMVGAANIDVPGQARNNEKETKEVPVCALRKTHCRHISVLPLCNNLTKGPLAGLAIGQTSCRLHGRGQRHKLPHFTAPTLLLPRLINRSPLFHTALFAFRALAHSDPGLILSGYNSSMRS